MLEINQHNLKPGPYKHYKGGTYVVETILTHRKIEDVWTKMQDPEVIYRNLDIQYEKINGNVKAVVKTFARPLSEFIAEVEVEGQMMKRFTAK